MAYTDIPAAFESAKAGFWEAMSQKSYGIAEQYLNEMLEWKEAAERSFIAQRKDMRESYSVALQAFPEGI